MNFLAHAEVARRIDDDPRFVLGAVLPDLVAMTGIRLSRSEVHDRIAAGWVEHHRADAVFHSSATFRTGVQAMRGELLATDLATGPRRAAAHVGWELLLDDVVSDDSRTVDAFRAAVDVGRMLTGEPRWHALLDRFADMDQPAPPDPMVVARRVQRACSRRRRLAFGDDHLLGLAIVLISHRESVALAAPRLLDEVVGGA